MTWTCNCCFVAGSTERCGRTATTVIDVAPFGFLDVAEVCKARVNGEQPRHCQYCGKPAEVFDVDGAWCSPQCQTYDRQSESTYWRKAVQA